ncbi:Wall-associated receptor kinase [Melia azedarach]|uniref:Wall-associated receptor kinase n=1 Tax=Melia azedarach TaxID=155640 RepID=A0ACC1Y107_MELAZ|nr:Wall-associated receptor kinase [Melia azedarach]
MLILKNPLLFSLNLSTDSPASVAIILPLFHLTILRSSGAAFRAAARTPTQVKDIEKFTHVPVTLEWGIYDYSFNLFARNKSTSYNSSSSCQISTKSNISSFPIAQCSCFDGYQGNPYLLDGCQDVDECGVNPKICGPDMICVNRKGGFGCYSPTSTTSTSVNKILLSIGIGLVGLFLLIIGAWKLWIIIKKRKEIKQKEKNFRHNGGLLLQQQLTSFDGNFDKSKLFNSKELDKATDHFNVNRILGQGGQGTVYKGMLENGRIVAVKKSKVIDEGKLEEFINEVVILSQINHRNVVRLLGCCLETKVPLLVYEYIPNGTLSQYLHDPNEELPLTWEIRLRIAVEVAGALSYLHLGAGIPIYHRDIKSTNILLDEKYRAKVADFGTSKSVAIDQTHVTTKVQGTFGYLDPEYFQSSQFTDKSDVYSFGVVLVELLTGEKAIFSTGSQEPRGLAAYFILSMEENNLFDILDPQVLKLGKREEIIVVANLAKQCLNLNGKKRPTMKEVAMELEGIQASRKESNALQIHEEIEYKRTEVIESWDIVSNSTTSTFDSIIRSVEVQPLLVNRSS